MEYKLTTKSVLLSLRYVLLFFICAVITSCFADIRGMIGILIFYLVLALPQLFLIIPYNRVSNYQSFQIEYNDEVFRIKFADNIVEKTFAELRSVQYHYTKEHPSSPILVSCYHMYYYRFEFHDGTKYYLTSLANPKPDIYPKGVFYDWYIECAQTYPTIK